MIPKFRVWDLDRKVMHYEEDLSMNFYQDEIYVEIETFPDFDNYELLDFELMQYTGFKDKNDVEIYVGDIIKHDGFPNNPLFESLFEVIQLKSGDWYIKCSKGGRSVASHPEKLEVIGNVYENPELQEGIE